MGTIQQRFEIDQPAASVYEALSQPLEVLQKMPGVTGVNRASDDVYRVIAGAAAFIFDADGRLLVVHRLPGLRDHPARCT